MKRNEDWPPWLAEINCEHKPPRRVNGLPMGMTDTCKCGATTYVLRHKGNDGSNKPGKRWDYWKGVRP